jgi:hypothetical protein
MATTGASARHGRMGRSSRAQWICRRRLARHVRRSPAPRVRKAPLGHRDRLALPDPRLRPSARHSRLRRLSGRVLSATTASGSSRRRHVTASVRSAEGSSAPVGVSSRPRWLRLQSTPAIEGSRADGLAPTQFAGVAASAMSGSTRRTYGVIAWRGASTGSRSRSRSRAEPVRAWRLGRYAGSTTIPEGFLPKC